MAKRGARVKPLRTIPAKSLRMLKAFLIRAPSLIAYRPKNNPPDYFMGRSPFGFKPQVIINKKGHPNGILSYLWWARRDSNPRPIRYERTALTN